ncbi:MAG: hypothetical protein ACI4Q0_03395 [Oligosphaeraceae bacterium]
MTTPNPFFESARRSLRWFRESPIMAGGGTWGVGERLVLTEDNDALEKIRARFPVFLPYAPGLEVLEQRRSDCNFQAALLFWLAGKILPSQEDQKTARDLLDFLYFRSGLLNKTDERSVIGGWTWTHIQRNFNLWMDDNAWCSVIPFLLAKGEPELDERYNLRKWAGLLASDLRRMFNRAFDPAKEKDMEDPEKTYAGKLEHPHWAAPVQCALALYLERLDPASGEYAAVEDAILRYLHFLDRRLANYNASELCYLMLLAGVMMFVPLMEARGRDLARKTYAELERRIVGNPYGILPAEHDEAPIGPEKADLIYTVNFCVIGLALAALHDTNYLEPARKMALFLAEIQDDGSERPELKGCWRGMYDCKTRSWGGGNRYEGGAGSIYSGWTNAPIAIAQLLVGWRTEHPDAPSNGFLS